MSLIRLLGVAFFFGALFPVYVAIIPLVAGAAVSLVAWDFGWFASLTTDHAMIALRVCCASGFVFMVACGLGVALPAATPHEVRKNFS